jgi:hypothetical protein
LKKTSPHFKREICLMHAFLNPTIVFRFGHAWTPSRMQTVIGELTSMLDHQMKEEPLASTEPASDEFFSGQPDRLRSNTQRNVAHPLSFWQEISDDLKSLAQLSIKSLGLLLTSASVERVLSIECSITGDNQMAMAQETISARALVQPNGDGTAPFLPEVRQGGPKNSPLHSRRGKPGNKGVEFHGG